MYQILVQRIVKDFPIPLSSKLKLWAKSALTQLPSAEMTIRVVDLQEIEMLNSTYRHKNKPTNVLSFPFEMPKDVEIDPPILGDVVICAEVILQEANQQNKAIDAHWAHMVVHGALHLQGYDHEKDDDAERMESEEIRILKSLGFDNPYQIVEK